MSDLAAAETISPDVRPSLVGRWIALFRRWSSYLIALLVIAGLALRWTIRDRYHPWALIYYTTPIPAIVVWLLLVRLIWPERATWGIRRFGLPLGRYMTAMILTFICWTVWSQFVFRAEPTNAGHIRFVFWNTARAPFGIEAAANHLKSLDASIIALVEANPNYQRKVETWQAELPEYKVAGTHFGGIIAVRGDLIKQHEHYLTRKGTSWCDQFDLEAGGQRFSLLLVDVASQLSLSRQEPLTNLAKLVEQLSDRPVIVAGDFNTPDDSVWFDPLRKICRMAFREQGTGYAATWPVPLPVLTLDQVWVNRQVTVSRCEHGWTTVSDHRPVLTELVIGPNDSE